MLIRRISCLVAVVLLSSGLTNSYAENISLATQAPAVQRYMTAAQWREHLHYLADQIQRVHPHPFHHVSQAELAAEVSALDMDILTLSDHDIEVRLARLIAMLGEGHSRLSLPGLTDPPMFRI
jgi:hypothetical protein